MILTRRANGLFLLTLYKPVITEVGRTERRDAWPQPGDPLSVNNLCDWSRRNVFRSPDLDPLQSVRVRLRGESIGEPFCIGRS